MGCVSVTTMRPAKNGWNDQDAVWDLDSGGPEELCIRWVFASPHIKGHIWGHKSACTGHVQWSIYSKRLNGQQRYGVDATWDVLDGLILVQIGEYDWTIHVWRRCILMSNYFDHLFYMSHNLIVGDSFEISLVCSMCKYQNSRAASWWVSLTYCSALTEVSTVTDTLTDRITVVHINTQTFCGHYASQPVLEPACFGWNPNLLKPGRFCWIRLLLHGTHLRDDCNYCI